MKKSIEFIDLFAGLGGFRQALTEIALKKNMNLKCVFVSEINENVIDTYTKNFAESKQNIIDIRNVDENCTQIPNHDFLFAGFPCQTFSNAGHKKGFLDEIRGTLFFEIVKILKNKKPKYALLENVKHIVNHDNGQTWKIIIEKLKELGYILPSEPLILNPLDFGIPQDRKRVFIPMVLKSKIKNKKIESLKFNFDSLYDYTFVNKTDYIITRRNIDKNFLEKNEKKIEPFFLEKQENGTYLINVFDAWNDFIRNVNTEQRSLPVIWLDYLFKKISTDNMPEWKKKYLNDMWSLYQKNKIFIDKWASKWKVDDWKIRERKFEWQAGKDINDIKKTFVQLRQSGIRCRRPVCFPTLVAMVQIPILFDNKFNKWRYLTPRETANLQSFPKTYKLYNEINSISLNSNFLTYMQIGNSVNVKIVSLIQEQMIEKFK